MVDNFLQLHLPWPEDFDYNIVKNDTIYKINAFENDI